MYPSQNYWKMLKMTKLQPFQEKKEKKRANFYGLSDILSSAFIKQKCDTETPISALGLQISFFLERKEGTWQN